jgi:hypothetical protein
MKIDVHYEARPEDPIHQDRWLRRQKDLSSTSKIAGRRDGGSAA